MSTHGTLLLIEDVAGTGNDQHIWLHAYHIGHACDAFQDLTTLPEWLLSRALLEDRRGRIIGTPGEASDDAKQAAINWSELGPQKLSVLRHVFAGEDQAEIDQYIQDNFDDMWWNVLSVDFDYCSASRIAGLMITKHFGLWNVVEEDSIPYHEIGDDPDIRVVCHSLNKNYTVIPSKEVVDSYSDLDDLDVSTQTVDFKQRLHDLFKAGFKQVIEQPLSAIQHYPPPVYNLLG